MPIENIRAEVEETFNQIIREEDVEIEGVEGYGHQAGMPIEEWVKNKLNENVTNFKIFLPNEFLQYLDISSDVENILETTWWGFSGYRGDRWLITRRQITCLENGEEIGTWQQSGSDLVLFYGRNREDRNKIISLNVKSHNTERPGRDPNILSAQRLLYFLKYAVSKNFDLNDINMWFLGVDYHLEGTNAIVESIHVKDLFKLDLSRLPIINFDAAIQIQWHVRNMIERDQSKLEFIRDLAQTFLNRWNQHTRSKTQKYERLVREIIESIESIDE